MKKIILGMAIFSLSIATYSYPLLKKGYSPVTDTLPLIQARNKALAGTYAYESDRGIFLSSHYADQAIETGMTNPLTVIIYGQVFKWFGFHPDLPIYFSIILFSICNVIIFLLVSNLFSLTIGLFSGAASMFMPVMVTGALTGGFYEWAILFFSIGLWFFLNPPKFMGSPLLKLIVASIFLALAALARNAFAISFVPLLLYDFYARRSWRHSFIFLLPFLIIFGSTLTPFSWLGAPNGYISSENQPFQQIGHFFNDPYSYHFNRAQNIDDILNDPEGIDRVTVEFASHWGYGITLKQNIRAIIESSGYYLGEFFKLITTGGILMALIIFLGAYSLYRKDKKLLVLFFFWIVTWLGYLSFSKTGNNDHFIEIIFMLSVLIGAGTHELMRALESVGIKKAISFIGVLVGLSGYLLSATEWRLHDSYRSSTNGIINNLLTQAMPLGGEGVVAIGVHPEAAYQFAYRSNRSVVYFNVNTIQDLIENKKLADAFKLYNVTEVVGYDVVLSNLILTQSSVSVVPKE